MSEFKVERSTVVVADPPRIHGLINDFRQWQGWSPWEGLDPDLDRTYSGPESGEGSHYAWSGNKRAGSGTMVITASEPDRIGVALRFLKPWKATNAVTFTLRPVAAGTEVTWAMQGEQKGLMGLVGRVIPMDKLVGKDFEKGLANLKARAEEPA
ncbi:MULTISPECIES: SRPBCC family protein [unclassified Nocardioides]|uniref:SRPBCC family protein n=1 Tax=unclassified Nocardioides TaxID=2615069 RepID=UPI0007011999|nr:MULTISPECIES: SRPBCC family protein [unclassified Nocardioides]KQY63712.1 transcriptional regulator [Nocardioides sp. Root140]KQZ67610.1 transcriptional regulator [Nocardioides sp. Root151]KRF15727.1 transcriptional regulator [Nocardioides sp. Soil796]